MRLLLDGGREAEGEAGSWRGWISREEWTVQLAPVVTRRLGWLYRVVALMTLLEGWAT